MKKIDQVQLLLKNREFTKKVLLYFSTKIAGTDYDPYEKNYTYNNLNPICIFGIVSQISPEALVWKQYGLSQIGAIEIIWSGRYKTWFEQCARVEVDTLKYEVYRDATGTRAIIQSRVNGLLIRVVLMRK